MGHQWGSPSNIPTELRQIADAIIYSGQTTVSKLEEVNIDLQRLRETLMVLTAEVIGILETLQDMAAKSR